MEIIVSTKDGLASFTGDDYFEENEAEKMKEFAESLGYTGVTITKTDQCFKDELNPLRKKVYRDIDWKSWKPWFTLIKNRDKSDEEIVKMLGSEGSGFSITVMRGKILTEYTKFLESIEKELTDGDIEKFCKKYVGDD